MKKISLNKSLKPREEEIIQKLLQFRFLTTNHIQILLNHKSKDKPTKWLNNLTKNQYIYRFYKPDLHNIPATYCLDKESIPYLQEIGTDKVLLKRVYKEKTLTPQFRNHCLLVVQSYLSLLNLTKTTNATLTFYSKTDLFSFDHLLSPLPDAYFVITETNKTKRRYFLDVFLPNKPWRTYKLRVQGYSNYYNMQDWQLTTKKPFPSVILICPDEGVKRWLLKKIQQLDYTEPIFYLSTIQKIQEKGLRKEALEKAIIL